MAQPFGGPKMAQIEVLYYQQFPSCGFSLSALKFSRFNGLVKLVLICLGGIVCKHLYRKSLPLRHAAIIKEMFSN